MESKVLKEYRVPAYPQKQEVQFQPSLLRKSVEKRWQKLYDLGISGMLVASLSLSGCDKEPEANTVTTQGIEESPNQNPNASQTDTEPPAKTTALVAPVFEHGNGRGATGCMVMTPPVFLSEEEALVVIKDELSKHGISLNKEKVLLKDVTITPGRDELAYLLSKEENKEMREKLIEKGLPINFEEEEPAPLEIDLQDSEKVINIEYVSREEYNELGGLKSNSTVSSYDIKKIAKQVRSQIQSDAKEGIFGVFYDPMPDLDIRTITPPAYNEQGELIPRKPNEESVNLLREQVQDFAQWLKEQGVI